MNAAAAPPGRRSHAERSAETVELIINATLDAIAQVGLRNATSGEISRRAGVSIGALFHHFETRLDIIVAAVEADLARRAERFAVVADSGGTDRAAPDPRELIGTFRSIAREPRSMVWLEVILESRTDPELRARVAPILAIQRDQIRARAELQPGLQSMSPQDRLTWIELLRNVVNGESIWEPVVPHHELDDAKLDALLALAADFAAAG